MKRRLKVLVSLLLVAGVVVAAPASAERPDDAGSAADEHRRILEFWTHERVSQAVPRDFVFDPGRGFVPMKPGGNGGGKPDKPGGGGGGVGGLVTVGGESWSGGGDVVDTTGKVLFAMGTSYYVYSASVVSDGVSGGRSIILTAAHCAYDETARTVGEGFASNWMFIPNYDAAPAPLTTSGSFCKDTLYGCWTATNMAVHNGYATAGRFNEQAVDYDFAVVEVGLGGKPGQSRSLDGTLGSQPISFDTGASGQQAYAFGYPAAKKYRGDDLVYCAGAPGFDPAANDGTTNYALDPCSMTGGSSGGPWFAGSMPGGGTIVSLNSYGYSGSSAMYGPVFDAATEAVFDAVANGTDGGSAVVTSSE